MDKEKLKKYAGYAGRYAGYAGLGLLGGYLGTVLGFGPFFPIYFFPDKPSIILILILGGCLGGYISNKWWVAFLVGFVPLGLISLSLLLLLSMWK